MAEFSGGTSVRINRGARKQNWLLIKERDAEARPGSGDAVLREHRTSVVTGCDLERLQSARDRVFQ
jgi:ATP-dependent DNA ligase